MAARRWYARSGAKGGALPDGGTFVAVVGPSGVGKDSLIAAAANQLAGDVRFHFVRRIITRPADPRTEDHDTVDRRRFAEMLSEGELALSWEAHGLLYGIPAQAVDFVAEGGTAIANLSRHAVAAAQNRFERVSVVHVNASPQIRAQRLAARGRENPGNLASRLARDVGDYPGAASACVIHNDGELSEAAVRFVKHLESLAAGR